MTTRLSFVLASCLCVLGCEATVSDLGTAAQQPPPPASTPRPGVGTFTCTPVDGPAPLTSTCSFTVSHPDPAAALSCTLTVDDGRAPLLENADCKTAGSQSLTFDAPGTFRLTLLARDPAGATAQSVVSFTVSPRPNKVPTVTTFTASPAAGTRPLNTTLSWAVADSDGDALKCDLDIGNDGSVDYAGLDCAVGMQTHTLAEVGTATVLLTVKDPQGASATAQLTLTARAPVGDVRIAKVEWGQSVVLENLRLVAGKSALLRVHALSDTAGLTGLVVDAEGFDAAGTSLGKLALTGPATVPTAAVPADLLSQWTGTVPAEWVAPGLEVRLKLDPADALPETDEANNAQSLKPLVGKGNVLQFTAVPVVHQGVKATLQAIEPLLTAMWPLKSINSTTRAPYTFSGTLQATSSAAWGDLLQDLAAVRQADGSSRYYYGWVRVSYGSGLAGIGYVGGSTATGRDDSIETAIHELGHNLGRNHAPCGGPTSVDPNYPYPGARLGSWGYDARSKTLINPTSRTDWMSYCDPTWVSDYNYKALQTKLETQAFIPQQAPSPDVVLVAGALRGEQVSLRPLQRLHATPSGPLDAGPFTLRLTTLDGSQRLYPFAPREVADADDGVQHFTLLLPDPGALLALEVLRGDKVLHAQVALAPPAAAAPRLERADEGLLRLRFAPGLTAALAHLADDGTRTTLALWLTGGDALVRSDGLQGGRYEVSLSSGGEARSVLLPAP